jgi:hypothetical protein
MHPAISYQLARARITDLHRQAQRDALASAAQRARRAQRRPSEQPAHALPTLGLRRALTVLLGRRA